MRVRRPKTKTARCAHCQRRRLAKFLEWHPGIWEWQCSGFTSCNQQIDEHARAVHPRSDRRCYRCRRHRPAHLLSWHGVVSDWRCTNQAACSRVRL